MYKCDKLYYVNPIKQSTSVFRVNQSQSACALTAILHTGTGTTLLFNNACIVFGHRINYTQKKKNIKIVGNANF